MTEVSQYDDVLAELRSMASPRNVEGMVRYGINPTNTLGVPMPDLRRLARGLGRNHGLAMQLWASGIHEARIVAALIDDPRQVTEQQMESWASDLDSWDVCDQTSSNLFDKTQWSYGKAVEWSSRDEEFVKRAGFVLMAQMAVHDKNAGDELFLGFLPHIEREAVDGRNFVKKAVNWALRQVGKRNQALNRAAVASAQRIQRLESKSARWIASDALRELSGDAVQGRWR